MHITEDQLADIEILRRGGDPQVILPDGWPYAPLIPQPDGASAGTRVACLNRSSAWSFSLWKRTAAELADTSQREPTRRNLTRSCARIVTSPRPSRVGGQPCYLWLLETE